MIFDGLKKRLWGEGSVSKPVATTEETPRVVEGRAAQPVVSVDEGGLTPPWMREQRRRAALLQDEVTRVALEQTRREVEGGTGPEQK